MALFKLLPRRPDSVDPSDPDWLPKAVVRERARWAEAEQRGRVLVPAPYGDFRDSVH